MIKTLITLCALLTHLVTSTITPPETTTETTPDEPAETFNPYAFRTNQVTLGNEHTCAISTDRLLQCWGGNDHGQLGYGDLNPRGVRPSEMGTNLETVRVGDGQYVTQATAGRHHTCALLATNRIKCWGRNQYGQLGLGIERETQLLQEDLPAINIGSDDAQVEEIVAGDEHTCARLSNGAIKCWGRNDLSQLGYYNESKTIAVGRKPSEMGNQLQQVPLGNGRSATQLSAGSHHTCAVLDTKQVACWGSNSHGQLGMGNDTLHTGLHPFNGNISTVRLGSGFQVEQVAAGALHTCALLDNGRVKCWGDNTNGKLGLGDTRNRGHFPDEMGDNLVLVNLGARQTALQITLGKDHTCVLVDSFSIKCWGAANPFGQTGLGKLADVGTSLGSMGDNLPTIDFGTTSSRKQIRTVVSGSNHNCVIVNELGRLLCWGSNTKGQVGLGEPPTRHRGNSPEDMGMKLPFVDLGGSRVVVSVVAGGEHTCMLFDNHKVKCFGANSYGQLGIESNDAKGNEDGSMGDKLPFVDFGGVLHVTQLGCGNGHSCALSNTGQVRCWGGGRNISPNVAGPTDSVQGQLGLGSMRNIGDDAGEMGSNLPVINLGTEIVASSIAVGTNHACVVTTRSRVKCWGGNGFGQLGTQDTKSRGDGVGAMGNELPFVPLGTNKTATQVSAGNSHSCAILTDGEVMCWGRNNKGQLGNESNMEIVLQPVHVNLELAAIQIASGIDHTCALLSNFRVKCWGSNSFGVLGIGEREDSSRGKQPGDMGVHLPFVDLGASRTVVDLAVGAYHNCVVLDNGEVKCWGSNRNGQLGIDTGSDTKRGVDLDEMGDSLDYVDLGSPQNRIVSVTCGNSHTCALFDNGHSKCWGLNSSGQLGLEDNTNRDRSQRPFGGNLEYVLLGVDPGCGPGWFTNGVYCMSCPAGTFQNLPFQSKCLECPPGSFSIEGAPSCTLCSPGFAQREPGKSKCDSCPIGMFQDKFGGISCDVCVGRKTTLRPGSQTGTACVAIQGTFLDRNGAVTDCPDWANCAGSGLTLATLPVRPGLWRISENAREAFQCLDKYACVGGSNGEFSNNVQNSTAYCRRGHRGPTCSLCVEGFDTTSTGLCEPCTSQDVASSSRKFWVLLISIGVIVVIIGVLTWFQHAQSQKWGSSRKVNSHVVKFFKNKEAYERFRLFLQHIMNHGKLVFSFFQVLHVYVSVFGIRAFSRESTAELLLLDPNFFSFIVAGQSRCHNISHNGTLLLYTIMPLCCCALFLLVLLPVWACTSGIRRLTVEKVEVGIVVALFALVTPGTLRVVFGTFPCDVYEDVAMSNLLRADVSLTCDEAWSNYALVMAVVYIVGVFCLFWKTLSGSVEGVSQKQLIMHSIRRQKVWLKVNDSRWKLGGAFLSATYKPRFRWFELVEFVRKILQAPMIVFYFDGEFDQIVICAIISVFVLLAYVAVRPFNDVRLTITAVLGQVQLLLFCQIAFLALSEKSITGTYREALDHWILAVVWVGPIVALLLSATAMWWPHLGSGSGYLSGSSPQLKTLQVNTANDDDATSTPTDVQDTFDTTEGDQVLLRSMDEIIRRRHRSQTAQEPFTDDSDVNVTMVSELSAVSVA